MQLPVYNQQGQKVSALEVSDALFGVKPKMAVLHQTVVAKQANARVAIAHTKTRGEVRGGGKKPWKQKGTGRARHGSIRSPIWRGGGITFGPRSERNFSQKINKKVRSTALRMALSDKAASEHLVVVDTIAFAQTKTKDMAMMIKSLPLKRGRTMIALPKVQKDLNRVLRNIDRITPIWAGSLNAADILKHANLVTTVEGMREMEHIYGGKSSKASKLSK